VDEEAVLTGPPLFLTRIGVLNVQSPETKEDAPMRRNRPLTSRREFLKTAASGLAGVALLSSGACSRSSDDAPVRSRKIVRRALGRTGLRLPVVSMGSAYAIDLVGAALDEGIVYIHTSSDYAEGNHERLLGEALKGRPRDSFVIGTSPDFPYEYDRRRDRSKDLGKGADPNRILRSMDASLQRLGLEYVDIYYLTSIGDPEVARFEPYLDAFETLKKAGKTRFIGIGTHENEPAVIDAAVQVKLWDVVLTAYNFRQSHRRDVRAAIRRAAGAGLGVVAMKTQAGVYWDRLRVRRINMKAALKWVLQEEHVHTTIPAFSNFDEMQEDLSIMEDLSLTEQEKRDLEIGDELGYSGLYCDQCGKCVAQCPSRVDIPTLMRSHMYAFGHRHPAKAKHTLRSWSPSDIACRSCTECGVRCARGFDVKLRVLEIARVLEIPEDLLS
jgi:predicted aldo/keto reductase-like oxidoreductase